MKRFENNKWLDKELSDAIGSKKPLTDFDAWKKNHPQAIEALTSRAQPKLSALKNPPNIRKMIMKSPIIKLAAAAVLLIGLFMLGRYLIGNEKPDDVNEIQITTANQQEEQNDTNRLEILLDSEMETAKLLFEKKDLSGMIQFLGECQDSTKIKIAEYLEQIGDDSVLPALQIFAEKWQGSELENPFIEAIEAINARIEETESESAPRAATSNQEPNKPQVVIPAEQTGIEGVVIDKNTSVPIEGALVGFRPNQMVATDAEGKFRLIYSMDWNEAFVTASASGYATKRIVVRIKRAIMQEVLIELSSGSKLVGTVYDPNGQPVEGAKVGIFGLSMLAGKVITDNEGNFEIDGLNPTGQYYQVHVEHPAYPAIAVEINPAPVGQILYQDVILKPGVTVFGQITNPQGMPVEGVTVGNTRSRSMWNNKTTETDTEGMYLLESLDIGELVLWTVHDQYATSIKYATLDKGRAEQQIDIQLREPRELHGQVVDDSGNPIPDATVIIHEYNGISNLDENRYSSNSDGQFIIPNAPPDGYLSLNIFGEGISQKIYKIDLNQEECLITVKQSGKIYGKVIDADTGEPITKFTVKMTDTKIGPPTFGFSGTWIEEGHTFDSALGLFDTGRESIPVNAQFEMTVSAEGYDPVTLDPVIVQPISENPDRTEFRLQSAKVYAGRVITSDGEPVQGVQVVFFSNKNAQYRESWSRAVTDKTGIFTISGLSDEPQCVFVSASGFTSRAYLMTNLLETPNHFADIVLDHAATLIGCVLDENGNGIAGASVHAFVDSSQIWDVLGFHPSLGPKVRTDKDGYYNLQDVPTGRVQISVMSPSNYNLGHKTVNLESGDVMELNFGDEGGFTITGTVRAGDDFLESAEVSISSRGSGEGDSYHNYRATDVDGRFKFIHVPAGTCMIFVNWQPGRVSKATKWPEDTKFEWRHSVEVKENMDLDIDLLVDSISGAGGGSISGVVPGVFQFNEGLSLSVMQLLNSSENDIDEKWKLDTVPDSKIEADGSFMISHVPEGQYYLVLGDAEKTLAISEFFEMAGENHIDGINFHHGNGSLLLRVIDARTGHRIPNAMFSLTNDLQTPFMDQTYVLDDTYQTMTTDENGRCSYAGLPKGRYQAMAFGYGYLAGQSEWANVADGRETELAVRLEPAALVRFELSDAVKEKVTTSQVLISCRVTDTTTRDVVKHKWLYGESEYHAVLMSLSEPVDDIQSILHLPAGTFEIVYNVMTMEMVNRAQVGGGENVARGSETVTCQTGQTTYIFVKER